MKKPNFSKESILSIATKLRTYKKLHVTTEGQMFKVKEDAEAAVRIKNIILDDHNEYVAIKELTSNEVTNEKLREYGKDTSLFDALFEDAKIPLSKQNKKPHERKREKPTLDDKSEVDNMADVMGMGKKKKETPKVETPKAETPKAEKPKVESQFAKPNVASKKFTPPKK